MDFQVHANYIKRKILITIFVGFCIVLILSLFLFSNRFIHILKEFNLLPKSESFTELYFTHHLDLPATVYQGQIVSFLFTLHNLEGKSMKYPYQVFIASEDGHMNMLDEKSITLADRESKSIQEGFIATIAARSAVVINLTSLNQQIDFWITPATNSATVRQQTPIIQKIPLITPIQKQYGGWYWNPKLLRAQAWLGKDKAEQDVWVDTFPTLTPTPTKKTVPTPTKK